MRYTRFKNFLVLLPFIIIFAAVLLIPFIMMAISSFFQDNTSSFSFYNFHLIFTQKFYYIAITNSINLSLFSSIIGSFLGLFVTYAITKLAHQTQNRLLLILNATSNFAGVPLAFAFIILLGNSGFITLMLKYVHIQFNLYTWMGLILVYVYFQLPLAIMLFYPVFNGIDQRWKEAAYLLGASNRRYWLKIVIPYLLPSFFGTLTILFANAMGAYATAYALTGGSFNLMSTRIGALTSGDINVMPNLGSAMALILALTMIIALFINQIILKKLRRDIG
ncbi:ABC transporter permease [Sporolactobacillus nakayamae]|uniref:Putative spermidine/putrescine transport system permease protein n=1 Tax=Sporolactobacillus nakayamae TaxID=269670 RepID=A0A1I2UCV1_9BACL|nr:ABC transporter permease subunit [Sporolactobacillus nakayamae]SFG74878.1 putative spermidine/putrescine transport system permease protein [Sporolactobacillus nakayamae]